MTALHLLTTFLHALRYHSLARPVPRRRLTGGPVGLILTSIGTSIEVGSAYYARLVLRTQACGGDHSA
jgi:hypothetical protein